MNYLSKYIGTLSYIICVLLVNVAFTHLPFFQVMGSELSPGDILVGSIYVVRDFAQREIGHKVIFAMIVAAILSYLLADPSVAKASLSAFVVGEMIDWAIFSFTKKPLSQRLLWSSAISSPIDSAIFLGVMDHYSHLEFTVMSIGKIFGVLVLWWCWKLRAQRRSN